MAKIKSIKRQTTIYKTYT